MSDAKKLIKQVVEGKSPEEALDKDGLNLKSQVVVVHQGELYYTKLKPKAVSNDFAAMWKWVLSPEGLDALELSGDKASLQKDYDSTEDNDDFDVELLGGKTRRALANLLIKKGVVVVILEGGGLNGILPNENARWKNVYRGAIKKLLGSNYSKVKGEWADCGLFGSDSPIEIQLV